MVWLWTTARCCVKGCDALLVGHGLGVSDYQRDAIISRESCPHWSSVTLRSYERIGWLLGTNAYVWQELTYTCKCGQTSNSWSCGIWGWGLIFPVQVTSGSCGNCGAKIFGKMDNDRPTIHHQEIYNVFGDIL
jgi:hypothetical protein